MQANNIIAQVLERMLPVGSIVEWSPVEGGKADLSTPAKVAAYYGFGTLEAYGSGQMLLGVSDGHAIGSTGGAESHILDLAELPKVIEFPYGDYNSSGSVTIFDRSAIWSKGNRIGTLNISSGGEETPIPVMPPYIVCYRWRRIA